MALKLVPKEDDDLEDDTALSGLAGGTCFDFNRTAEHLFVVGTDEGSLHKCSQAYNAQYLETFKVSALKLSFEVFPISLLNIFPIVGTSYGNLCCSLESLS